MSALIELAVKCEAATGPSHLLDAEIAVACLGFKEIPSPEGDWRCFESPDGARANIQRRDGVAVFDYGPLQPFTASLDAAATLVPLGYSWSLYSDGTAGADKCVGDDLPSTDSSGHTPALALCAAALRARSRAGL